MSSPITDIEITCVLVWEVTVSSMLLCHSDRSVTVSNGRVCFSRSKPAQREVGTTITGYPKIPPATSAACLNRQVSIKINLCASSWLRLPSIRQSSPPLRIRKASISSRCRSVTQQLNTEQTVQAKAKYSIQLI